MEPQIPMVENLKIFLSSHLLSRCYYWERGSLKKKKKPWIHKSMKRTSDFVSRGFEEDSKKTASFPQNFSLPTTKKNTKGKTSPKKTRDGCVQPWSKGNGSSWYTHGPKHLSPLKFQQRVLSVQRVCIYIYIYIYIYIRTKKRWPLWKMYFLFSDPFLLERRFRGFLREAKISKKRLVWLFNFQGTDTQTGNVTTFGCWCFAKCWGNCSPSRLTQVFTFHVTHLPKHPQHSDLWFDANQEVQMLSYHQRVGWIHKIGVCAKSGNLAKGIRSEKGLISHVVSWFQGCFGRFCL